MSSLILQWRRPPPAVVVRWRGQDGAMLSAAPFDPPAPLAAIIGPPGTAGPAGPQGPDGPPFDISAAVIDGGTFN
jgi:hypothetical protein